MGTNPTLLALATTLILCFSGCSGGDDGGGGGDGGTDGAADGSDAGRDGTPGDPCDPNPCEEPSRTVCVPLDEGHVCQCDPSFHDDGAGSCVADEGCLETTCSGHGRCAEEEDGLECDCEVGYSGQRCEECDLDAGYVDDGRGGCTNTPCDPSPCEVPGRSRCVVEDGAARCECDAGSHDEGGECVPDLTCLEGTCNAHGECREVDEGIVCDCHDGYAGPHCSECNAEGGYHPDGAGGCSNDPCVPSPCSEPNRSVCVVGDDGEALCECDASHHLEGDLCVADEVCEGGSCDGHGACSIVGGRVACDCDEGYLEPDCVTCDDVGGFHPDGAGGCTDDPCVPSPCTDLGQTVCVAEGGAARCDCDDGYHPDGVGGCTDDPCVPDPCAPDLACRPAPAGGGHECYEPVCDDGEPCTDDRFEGGGCVHDPLDDDMGCSTTLCIRDEVCDDGVCGGGSVVTCDDGNPCTDDSCDALTGCDNVPNDGRLPDDGVACTVDSCDGGAAVHEASHGICDDDSWCTGVETCEPATAGADGRGCIRRDVPTRPGPEGPCLWYTCDDGSHAFTLHTEAPGVGCNDGIHCTVDDECVAGGACLGTPTPSCDFGEGSCSSLGELTSNLDVPRGYLSGSITLAGGPLPDTSPSSTSLVFDLVSRDTGIRHRIASVGFGGCCSSYTRAAGSESYESFVVPGVYDVLFARNYSSNYDYVYETIDGDPFVNGFRTLQEGVVVPAGPLTLDLDVPAATISGNITLAGGPLPDMSPSSTSLVFDLISRDTGIRHRIASVGFGGCCSSYTRAPGSESYESLVVPGVYDLLYARNYSSNYDYVYETIDGDPFVNGFRTLQEGVVIGAGSSTLDLDVPAATVSGQITLAGGPLPDMSPSSTSLVFDLVSRDTGKRHRIASVGFGGCCSSYTRAPGSESYESLVVPGVYDLLYARNYSSNYDYVYETIDGDPFVNGFRTLQEGVVIGAGSSTLDLDVPAATISGNITLAGGPLPDTSPSSTSLVFDLVSRDTGKRHRIASVGFGGCCSSYTRAAGSESYESLVMPGVYDLLYARNYSSTYDYVYETIDGDPFVNGFRTLQEGVVIGPGSSTLDLDVPAATISGSITLAGGPLPDTSPSSSSLVFDLVSRDTGKRHRIASVGFGGCCSSYNRAAGSESYESLVVPGDYDLLYARNYSSTYDYVYETIDGDPFVNGFRILQEGVVVAPGSSTLDLDVPAVTISGDITLAGGPLPDTSPSSSSLLFDLVSRDTGIRHRIASVGFGGCCSSYTRATGSESYESLVMPGAYDVLFARNYSSNYDYVYETIDGDPFVNGFRNLQSCVIVP